MFTKSVLILAATAILSGLLATGWYFLKEHYRDQGRVEVQLVFDKYKSDAQQAADQARAENAALEAKNAALATQLAKRIGVSLAALNTKTQEVANAIQSAPIAECRLPDGLHQSVNAVRAGAAAEIDAAYKPQGEVQ